MSLQADIRARDLADGVDDSNGDNALINLIGEESFLKIRAEYPTMRLRVMLLEDSAVAEELGHNNAILPIIYRRLLAPDLAELAQDKSSAEQRGLPYTAADLKLFSKVVLYPDARRHADIINEFPFAVSQVMESVKEWGGGSPLAVCRLPLRGGQKR